MNSKAPFLILAGLALTGCERGQTQTAQSAPADKPQTVEVVPVKSSVMASTVALPAQLLPYESVDLFPRVAGFIQDIAVDRGSQVKRGQVLVRLNAPELTAQREQVAGVLRAAEAKAAADRATYERLANAAKTPGVVAENDVNIARQTSAADDAQVASARESLKNVTQQEAYLQIRAPFDGVVTARNLHPGALVGPSSGAGAAPPILQLVNVKRLRLVIPVPVADVQGMKPGQTATFTVPSLPGRKLQAPIARIAEALDNKTRTMAVELDVANPDGALTAGEFGAVQWPVKRSYPTLQVPQTAIANDQQRQFVIRVAGGVTQWVDVTTGVAGDGKIEVFGQLKPGDQVVRRGSDALQAGTKVEAKASS
jgi:RND family efflux transporter MFP subunit